MPIKKGDTIKVHYTGSLEDGEVFDSSEKHGRPLEFEVGSGMIIKGFDEGILGMKKGDEKELKIEPKDAYGDHNAEYTRHVPKEDIKLPEGQEPEVGMILGVTLPNGQQLPAKVSGVTEEEIIIDLNHPLAGKTLNFKIKLVEVREKTEEEMNEENEDEGCDPESCSSCSGCGHH